MTERYLEVGHATRGPGWTHRRELTSAERLAANAVTLALLAAWNEAMRVACELAREDYDAWARDALHRDRVYT